MINETDASDSDEKSAEDAKICGIIICQHFSLRYLGHYLDQHKCVLRRSASLCKGSSMLYYRENIATILQRWQKKCTVVGLIASANTKLIDYDNSQVFIAIVANSVDLFNIDEMGGVSEKMSGFQIKERWVKLAAELPFWGQEWGGDRATAGCLSHIVGVRKAPPGRKVPPGRKAPPGSEAHWRKSRAHLSQMGRQTLPSPKRR